MIPHPFLLISVCLFLLPHFSHPLPTLPEIFLTHPLTHPNFSTLSATTLALHPSGDLFIAGVAHPMPMPIPTPLPLPQPFLARLDKTATLQHITLLNCTGHTRPVHLVYHSGYLFLTGTTTGTLHTAVRTTAPGTPSVFLAKLTLDARFAWQTPLVFGSARVDAVSALALDSTAPFPHLFLVGCVGAHAFPMAHRHASDLTAPPFVPHRNPSHPLQALRGKALRVGGRSRHSDLFVAKVHPADGAFEAVQLPLDRDNSADGIVVRGDHIYTIVNSYSAAPFDPEGTSALYVFKTKNLNFHAVHLPRDANKGEYLQSIGMDNNHGLYLGGVVMKGHNMESGYYSLSKYNVKDQLVEWDKSFGEFTKIEPRVSLVVGDRSGHVFVTGHTTRLYESEDPSGSDLVVLPLTMFSGDGMEIMSWNRTSPFPVGYEEIRDITLDRDENLVYAGKWLNPSDGMYDATVGSFGASLFTARVSESEAQVGYSTGSGAGLAGSTIGLICVAAGVAVVLGGVALYAGRNKVLGNKGLEYEIFGASEDEGADADMILDKMDEHNLFPAPVLSTGDSDDVRVMVDEDWKQKTGGPGGSSGPF